MRFADLSSVYFEHGEGCCRNKRGVCVFKGGSGSGEMKISQHELELEMCFECCGFFFDYIFLLLSTSC